MSDESNNESPNEPDHQSEPPAEPAREQADGSAEAQPPEPVKEAPREKDTRDIHPKPFEGHRAPARLAGVLHQYSEAAQGWTRHVLRRYADRGNYWSRTIFVPEGVHFCMGCLSTKVIAFLDLLDRVEVSCQEPDCGIRYVILDEDDPNNH